MFPTVPDPCTAASTSRTTFDLRNLPETRARAACGVLVAIYTQGLDAETKGSAG